MEKNTDYRPLKYAAAKLRLTYETMRRKAQRGQLQGVIKVGGSWRVDMVKLEESLK